MRIPIRLPSKKYVDKSTLDKYVRERESNRETVVDPFTRLPFTSTHKPIIDEELKSRIDKFLFDNRMARLVPKKSSPQKPTLSVATSSNSNKSQRKEEREELVQPMRSKRLKTNDNKKDELSFCRCDLCLNQKEFSSSTPSTVPFYQLEICQHVFCRHCLLVLKNICSKCKKSFANAQVTNIDKTFNR